VGRAGAGSGETLLARTGIVNHGPDPRLPDVAAALDQAGIRAEVLSPAEAGERWRGLRFDQQALHMPDGGQLNPEAALPPSSGSQRPAAPKSGTTPKWLN
jgi:sarcosine oxidase